MREDTRLDEEIREVMKKDFPLPLNVKSAQEAAFAQIRRQAQESPESEAKKEGQPRPRRRFFVRSFAGLAAVAALFLAVCIADPAFAAQIPLVGRVFQTVGDSLRVFTGCDQR